MSVESVAEVDEADEADEYSLDIVHFRQHSACFRKTEISYRLIKFARLNY